MPAPPVPEAWRQGPQPVWPGSNRITTFRWSRHAVHFRYGFHEAAARRRSPWRNHVQCSNLDAPAREIGGTLSNGRRRDRSGIDRADRLPRYHSRVGARVRVSRRRRSAEGCHPRSRQEHLPGALPLPASARQAPTTAVLRPSCAALRPARPTSSPVDPASRRTGRSAGVHPRPPPPASAIRRAAHTPADTAPPGPPCPPASSCPRAGSCDSCDRP